MKDLLGELRRRCHDGIHADGYRRNRNEQNQQILIMPTVANAVDQPRTPLGARRLCRVWMDEQQRADEQQLSLWAIRR